VNVTSTTPQQQQRMVGMEEIPLQVKNINRIKVQLLIVIQLSYQVRKADTKFVLKKVGHDPSWRARLGNLMSENR